MTLFAPSELRPPAEMAPPDSPRHLHQLDALRGIAALMVLSFHLYGESFHWTFTPPHTIWEDLRQHRSAVRWLAAPAALGYAGVPLFFVLSGFCIHYAFLRSARPFSYRRFMWKRFWRIYPAYVAAIALALLLREHPLAGVPHWRKTLLLHLSMLHNVSDNTLFEWNPSFWTLAIEFQFYAAYPLLLLLRQRLGIHRAVGLLGAMTLVLLSGFTWLGVTSPKLVMMPLVSWVQWGLGALLAERMLDRRPVLLRPVYAVPVCVSIILLLPRTNPWEWNMLLWAIVAASLMDTWVRSAGHRVPRLLIGLGAISYSIYLIHQPMILALLRCMPRDFDQRFERMVLVAPPLIVAVATISFFLIERPGMWIGHRRKTATNVTNQR